MPGQDTRPGASDKNVNVTDALLGGHNSSISFGFAEKRTERLPDLAHELVQLKPDLIIAGGKLAIRAIKSATSTIPIVMASDSPPGRSGPRG